MGPGLDKTKTGAAQKHRAQHLQHLSQYNIPQFRIPQLGSVYASAPQDREEHKAHPGVRGTGQWDCCPPRQILHRSYHIFEHRVHIEKIGVANLKTLSNGRTSTFNTHCFVSQVGQGFTCFTPVRRTSFGNVFLIDDMTVSTPLTTSLHVRDSSRQHAFIFTLCARQQDFQGLILIRSNLTWNEP